MDKIKKFIKKIYSFIYRPAYRFVHYIKPQKHFFTLKRIIILIISLSLSLIFIRFSYLEIMRLATKGANPISYWSFNEGVGSTAYDTMGANNGALGAGSSAPSRRDESECISGRCMLFDGTNDLVGVPDSNSLDQTTAVSISVWFKGTQSSVWEDRWQNLVTKKNNTIGNYALGLRGGATNSLQLSFYNSAWKTLSFPVTNISVNAWHHAVGVIEDIGTDVQGKLYVDGKMVTSGTWASTNLLSDTLPVGIGNFVGGTEYFKGHIDEVKIYNYARTDDQVKADFVAAGGKSGIAAVLGTKDYGFITNGLIAHWKMDETAADSCSGGTNDSCDSSGNGLDSAWNGNAASAAGKFGPGVVLDGTGDYLSTAGVAGVGGTSTLNLQVGASGDDGTSTVAGGVWHLTGLNGDGYTSTSAMMLGGRDLTSPSTSGFRFTNVNLAAGTTINSALLDFMEAWGGAYGTNVKNRIYASAENDCTLGTGASMPSSKTKTDAFVDWDSNGSQGSAGQWYQTSATVKPPDITQVVQEVISRPGWVSGNDICILVPDDGSGSDWWFEIRPYESGSSNAAKLNLSYTQIGVTTVPSSRAYSLSAWVKPTASVATKSIMAKNSEIRLVTDSSSRPLCQFHNGTDWQTAATSSTALTLDTWQHVACTFDKKVLKVFVNGVETGSQIMSTELIDNTANAWRIGSDAAGTYGDFKGTLDEVRIYNRSLAPSEVAALYGFAPGPVGYWKLDENAGSTNVYDDSQYNNTGTMSFSLNPPVWTQGKYGSAIDFQGTNDSIFMTDSASLSITSDLTVSAWIYPKSNTAATTYSIAGKWNNTIQSYGLVQYGDELRMYIGSTASYVTTNSANLALNNWYFVSSRYMASSQQVEIYLNGVSQAVTVTGTIPTSIADSTNNVYIAAQYGSGESSTLDLTVAASTDDAVINDATYVDNGTSILFGGVGVTPLVDHSQGYRFNNVTVPKGATVTNAYLTLVKNGADWTITAERLTAIDEDDTPTFSSGNPPGARPITSSFITSESLNENKTDGSTWSYPNDSAQKTVFSGAISAVVNRAGWVSGNDLAIVNCSYQDSGKADCSTYGRSNFRSYDYGTPATNAPKLHLEYTTPAGAELAYLGIIDEIKIYNYARTPTQIIEDMNGGHPVGGSPVGSQVGYWKFDEGVGSTAYDWSPQRKNGVLGTGASLPTWTNAGKLGGALSFDGTGDYVDLGSDPGLAPAQMSFSFWVYPRSRPGVGSYHELLRKEDSYYAEFSGSIGGYLTLGVKVPASIGVNITSAYVPLNAWTHVTVTADGSVLRAFLNGVQYGADVGYTGNIQNTATNHTWVGAYGTNVPSLGRYFDGIIDELKIYSAALTAGQVKMEYSQGKSTVLGALSTEADGTSPSYSNDRKYCVPGDTSTCNPPVLELTMNEGVGMTTVDTSGNGFNGSFQVGASQPRWTTGKVGSGIAFDGSSDFLSVEDNNILDFTASYTVSLWYYPSSFSHWHGLINKGIGVCTTNCSFDLYISPTTGLLYFVKANGASYYQSHADYSFVLNKWTHITVVDSGAAILYYINGKKVATLNNSGSYLTATPNSEPVVIGTRRDGIYTEGKIDEVKLYNYARTPAQVAWEVNRGAPVVWYKMDECTGTTINDWGADGNGGYNGRNGTLSIGSGGSQTAPGSCSTSGAWLAGSTGVYNASMSFDGSDDYISIGDSDIYTPSTNNPLSVVLWAKLASDNSCISNSCYIIAKGAVSNYEWGIHLGDTYPDSSGQVVFNLWQAAGANYARLAAPSLAKDWGWHNYAFTIDYGNRFVAYVDGKSIGSTSSFSGSVANGTAPVTIGKRSDSAKSFKGQIDDVKIFNFVLTPSQIKTVKNQGAVRFE